MMFSLSLQGRCDVRIIVISIRTVKLDYNIKSVLSYIWNAQDSLCRSGAFHGRHINCAIGFTLLFLRA